MRSRGERIVRQKNTAPYVYTVDELIGTAKHNAEQYPNTQIVVWCKAEEENAVLHGVRNHSNVKVCVKGRDNKELDAMFLGEVFQVLVEGAT